MRTRKSVLIVEDFAPFRAVIANLLQERTGFQVLSEASDGLEAVRRAGELKPNLIFIDIGLPGISGIEAARRIRELAPRSRIIFLSQEESSDLVEEALNSGALGYVHKREAANDLFPAIAAVLAGKKFVSGGLAPMISRLAQYD